MCVAAFAWDAHPAWILVAAANRDEFHDRPTQRLARWHGADILAGRDLRSGGTWLGISEAGGFSLLTNFRNPLDNPPARPSRGAIVPALLRGEAVRGAEAMHPFNAVLVSRHAAQFLGNYPQRDRRDLAPGVHGLSNGPFDRPWPKTRQLCAGIGQWLQTAEGEVDALLDALRAETPRPTPSDPGDGPRPEHAGIFIRDPHYGTRCSTVVAVHRSGEGIIVERSFDPEGQAVGEVRLAFRWPAA